MFQSRRHFFFMAFAIMFLVKKNVFMVEFSGEKTGKEIFIEVFILL